MTSVLEMNTPSQVPVFAKISREEVTMAAHDLRNPLACLVSTLELLESTAEKGVIADLSKVVHRGLRAVNRMEVMIGKLLDNAQLQSQSKPQSKPQSKSQSHSTAPLNSHVSTHLAAVVENAVEHSLLHAQKKGIAISQTGTNILTGPNILTGIDENLLVEALDNLISNAVKYSKYGSDIICNAGQDSNSVFIQVIDQGMGLIRKDLAEFGEPFHRLSARPTAGEKSTGFGLWSTRRIMNSLGGELLAESNGFNQGAMFTLRLPKAPTKPVQNQR